MEEQERRRKWAGRGVAWEGREQEWGSTGASAGAGAGPYAGTGTGADTGAGTGAGADSDSAPVVDVGVDADGG